MFKNIKSFFQQHWITYTGILVLWVLIVIANYTPGTWLIGWDNLHPEINPLLNLERTFFSVWRNYQGLGLLAGIAHASDITRQIFLLVLSIILPTPMLRYAWTFLMLLIGPIGVYHLVGFIFHNDKNLKQNVQQQWAATTSAFFYLFNIATVQYFFVPLEAFSSFYGFLPWLLLTVFRYYKKPNIRRLLEYAVISLFATSAFHVQTMFVTFSTVLAFISLEQIIRNRFSGLKSVLLLGITTLAIHSFWLLPIIYFTLNSADATVLSKQNLISTPETQLQNEYAGSLFNIMQLKGYWFDLTTYDIQNQETVYLLETWRNHFSNPLIITLSLIIFFIVVLGFIFMLLKNKGAFSYSLFVTFIFSVCMLSAGNGYLGIIYNLLSEYVPLFGQMFRVAFTKWSIVTALCYSIGIGAFALHISTILSKKKMQHLHVPISLVLISLFIFITFPILKGELIYSEVRLAIPNAYFELFNFLATQPKENKIVHLPSYTFWGWQHNDWGYKGSGFIWYGIQQPVIDRNFDVWSSTNEQLYHQLETAIQQTDKNHFLRLISKYNLSYVLIDESITAESQHQLNQKNKTLVVLNELDAEKIWSKDFLSVYLLPNSSNKTAMNIQGPLSRTTRVDFMYKENLDYWASQNSNSDLHYPFSDLTATNLTQTSSIQDNPNSFKISRQLPVSKFTSTLYAPGKMDGEKHTTNVNFDYIQDTLQINFNAQIKFLIENKEFSFPSLPPITIQTPEIYDSIFIKINNQEFQVKQGEKSNNVPLQLVVGQPISVQYFSKDSIFKENDQQIVYESNVNIFETDNSVWNNIYTELSLEFKNTDKIEAIVSVQPTIFSLQEWGYSQNCDIFERGKIFKESAPDLIKYTATEFASLCDGFSLSGIKSSNDQILMIENENKVGRPLKFYIENLGTKTAELEEIVTQGKGFYTLLASSVAPDLGYYLTLETKSFGGTTINEVSDLKIFTVDLDPLMRTKILSNTGQINETIEMHTDVNQIFPFLFTSKPDTNSLLVLPQSYNLGWIAFPKFNVLDTYEHVSYNGWANGWLIPQSDGEKTLVYMLYWPQILSLVGFGLSIGTSTMLLLFSLKMHKS